MRMLVSVLIGGPVAALPGNGAGPTRLHRKDLMSNGTMGSLRSPASGPLLATPTEGESGVSACVLSRDQTSLDCGCAAKVSGARLKKARASALGSAHAQPEDCALLSLPGGVQILATVDFGPPPGPDMFLAGRISAFHALSDVYAMGGSPLYALAIITAARAHPQEALEALMAGLNAACQEEGVQLAGGHTTIGDEAVSGLVVIGAPGAVTLEKTNTRLGDILMLSKPIGTGMLLRAYRLGYLELEDIHDALATMNLSNRAASKAALNEDVSALTDLTGYGLLGHTAEITFGTKYGAVIELDNVPILPAAKALPAMYSHSTFMDDNYVYANNLTPITGIRDRSRIGALLDPQTSGGLLASVAPDSVPALELAGFHRIGHITAEHRLEIR